MIRRIIMAGVIAMAPAIAQAVEGETLYRSGAWEVMVNIHDSGKLDCSADVKSQSGRAWLSISVDHDDFYRLIGFVAGLEDWRSEADLPFRIGPKDWTLYDADLYTEEGVTIFSFGLGYGSDRNATRFISDIMRYQSARLVIRDRRDEIFSLRGSSNAIKALEKCRVLLP